MARRKKEERTEIVENLDEQVVQDGDKETYEATIISHVACPKCGAALIRDYSSPTARHFRCLNIAGQCPLFMSGKAYAIENMPTVLLSEV